jgi:hypothetical protein
MSGASAPLTQEESKGFLSWSLPTSKMHRLAGVLEYDHHSIWRNDRHTMPVLLEPPAAWISDA